MQVNKLAVNYGSVPAKVQSYVLKRNDIHNADSSVRKLLSAMGVYNVPHVTKTEKLTDLSFNKGVARDIKGNLFTGTIKDTLKNGKNIEITYKSGRWQKSRISQKGTSYATEKFAKYDKDNKLTSVNKVYIQNKKPVMAKVTKFNDNYYKAERYLDINTTKYTPVKKGQKLAQDEMDRCFRADFFKEYNPEKYTGLGIIKEDKSYIFKQDRYSKKWYSEGVKDNLKKLLENLNIK